MTDPNTGEPIILPGRRVLIAPQIQALSLNQLMQAQPAWKFTQGGATPADRRHGRGPRSGANPLMDLNITMATSRQLYKQIQLYLDSSPADAAGYWWYGDPAAFAYMENWPITVVQAPTNSEAEFVQDIVVRFKASERGTPAVMEPRRIMRLPGLARRRRLLQRRGLLKAGSGERGAGSAERDAADPCFLLHLLPDT